MVIIKDGIVKKKCKFDIYKLYNYLYSRNFNYLPEIVNYERDEVSFKYVEDYSIDLNQKSIDLIKLVGLLHSKTSYSKDIVNIKYKDIYDNLKNNLLYLDNYYSMLFDGYIGIEYLSPSKYLFLRNYSIIDGAIKYCLKLLEEWNIEVIDKNKQRVSVVHNNLMLDHYIKNDREYLISFDNYIIDSPVIDLYKFFRNDWRDINFKELYNEYTNMNKLNKDEELLLFILVCMPYEIKFDNKEIDNVRNVRGLINYLIKGFELIKE